jgi:uncharacterized membrane-anchored protein YhcB (DUF1043 family)
MMMEKNDLTQIKQIGPARMRLFNNFGITTIKQLYEMPTGKLAGIKSIGNHYAKLIKNSVIEHYSKKQKKLSPEIVSVKEKKLKRINREFSKTNKRLKKHLRRANELLQPLQKKKRLKLYIHFKTRSVKLKASLKTLERMQQDLPRKVKKNIIKKVDALDLILKGVKKNPKKEKYKEVITGIQSFSKMIETVLS